MGLDTSHDCWHGPYGSFNRFRTTLAKQIGIDLNDYNGYGGEGNKDLNSIDHDIMPLLNHSDCDGRLTIAESRRIIKGLNNILENYKEDIPCDYDFKEQIERFRNGCTDAVSKRQMIKFQ
jgi:hypothetical protein